MKVLLPLISLVAGILLTGCVHHHPAAAPAGVVLTPTIVTPNNALAGKVVAYNSAGRFVVLNYPTNQLPKMDQTLFLYRAGLKVGEIKVTGPQSDDNTVADLVTGEAQVGDEVREQ
jgi:hypothetical protein